MAIAPISTIQSNVSDSVTSSQGSLNKNDFLLLFVTQLQNQDPLNPMDNSQMATQTAQFASLEQLQNVNGNLDNLQKYQSAIIDENAVSFVGKTVKAKDNTVDLTQDESANINFDLDADATSVYASIYDAAGNLVAEVDGSSLSAGENHLSWDGTMSDGTTRAPAGTYTVDVKAVDANSNTFSGVPFCKATVTRANFGDGTATLTAGNRNISLVDVLNISNS
jgi:flagellar basal-body rod modification protein FlgD